MEKANNAVLCNGTLSLLRHCNVSLLRTTFPRSQKAHASPSFLRTRLSPRLLAALPSSQAAPLNSHGRCCGNPAPHLLRDCCQLVRWPWHQPHPHLDGATGPCSHIQPQLLFSTLFKANSASMTPAGPLFPSKKCFFPSHLPELS